MDATQVINNSILESEEEENENEKGQPLAKLRILRNEHIPEAELPLFLGDNMLGRDPKTCTLPLSAPSLSKRHATISISVYRGRGHHGEVVMEALVWDVGSMNGTRKGRLKLTPNVRYALSDGDSLVMADIPCQYVMCTGEKVAHQEDSRSPLSIASGDDATKASSVVPLPDQEDTKETPARTKFLSFEQTPTHPQGILVPESDSESDEERRAERSRRCKAVVSGSDSDISSPTCATFSSPINKIIPESEAESPITPSSSTKNRPNRLVSFRKEETDVDLQRQQLKKKETQVTVDDSEEGRVEARAAPGERKLEESQQHVTAKEKHNVSLTAEDELPASTPAVSTDAVPVFNMDSDTDMEGEEEEESVSKSPETENAKQQSHQPTNQIQFHTDSDTDVDEADDALDKSPKSVPSSERNTTLTHAVAVIQPTRVTVDSDTDVDDDADAAVPNVTTKAAPTSLQSAHAADSAPSKQPKDFHMDSDTDVDEEEEKECGTKNIFSEIGETPSRLDLKPIGVESTPAAPHSLHLDSDTDDEAIPVPAISKPPLVAADRESPTTAETGGDLEILSNSDTDVETDAPLLPPVSVRATNKVTSAEEALVVDPVRTLAALQSDSDADTDVDESSAPSTWVMAVPADIRLDNDTDVENKEADPAETDEGQIPVVHREKNPGLQLPQLQKCSTPVALPVGEVEEMETQAFLNPSSGPFRCALTPPVRPGVLASCSDSQEDEDFVVAETQSFVVARGCQSSLPDDLTMDATQTFVLESSSGDEKDGQASRGISFHLGLSGNSHLQCQAQALAMESTQAFTSLDGGRNLEDKHTYGAISSEDRTCVEKNSNSDLEATQAYRGEEEEEEEPARFSSVSGEEGHVDFAQEATQEYIHELHSDPEDETEEDRTNVATAETQPLVFPTTSTLAMAETQPMSAFEEEETKGRPLSSVPFKPKKDNETEEGEEEPQEKAIIEFLSIAETQPVSVCDNEESDDEDSIPVPRKRKAKPLRIEDTQSVTGSEPSAVEIQHMQDSDDQTQPMVVHEDQESDDELVPSPQKRKAKPLQLLDEETQPLTNSELSVETKPMHGADDKTQPTVACEDDESDDEESFPGLRKRKAKPLQTEEETQSLTCSELPTVETQPMTVPYEADESDDEDSILGPRKRKAKRLQFDKEATQPLANSEVSATEAQLMQNDEDNNEKGENVAKAPSPKRGRLLAQNQQAVSNAHISNPKTQPITACEIGEEEECNKKETKAGPSGVSSRSRRGTRARESKEEEQEECFAPPKRQTRGKDKALTTTRGKRGNSRPEEDEKESEEDEIARSRSNSVSSERSASSVNAVESRGRGRGAKRSRQPDQSNSTRNSNRRRTVAGEPSAQRTIEQDTSPPGVLSRCNSTNSLNSEISGCSGTSQNRGRGGRQRGRGRKTEPRIPPISSQGDQSPAPKPTPRGRKSRKAEETSNEDSHIDNEEKGDAQKSSATRGRRRAAANNSQPAFGDEEGQPTQKEECATEEPLLPKRNIRGRSQKVATPAATPTSDGDEGKNKQKGRKKELEEDAKEDDSSGSKTFRWKGKAQRTEAAEEEEEHKDETKEENPAPTPTKRRGRPSSTEGRKNSQDSSPKVELKEETQKVEEKVAERKARGRPSVAQKQKQKKQEEGATALNSMDQDANVEATEPQTPTSRVSRKRLAPEDSSPLPKTPRSSCASPTAGGRSRAAGQAYKVLFTGVVDEAGERLVARLGGTLAKGVMDMNCLVTDKVRRTVKFLCGVAKGVPIVTPHWLEKSGKAGNFLSPNAFIVKDLEQEKKFNFCLQESLRIANSQPLLQGYEIHVTKSVKPEPVHMKDIICCSGAAFLSRMPSSNKAQTIVISCAEDWPLCGPAISASVPVLTAEFILTGILQQKLDFQTHTLSAPATNQPSAAGRGRGRKNP
ncbi:hypothetical protein LDENG_00049770 [Lucifuga dentata]|nr:hypothetical protein LDENG_00049770 [Lucifuga dentata]